MREIELVITKKAGAEFPNKLLPDGSMVGLDEQLKEEIRAVENELKGRIDGFDTALEASRAAIAAEEKMLCHCGPQSRWIDLKAPARRALQRGRVQYLRALMGIFSE